MNLKELSRFLGLSQTTVSRALNGFPEVSEQTRLRVAEAAQRHNYRPNARARGLATGPRIRWPGAAAACAVLIVAASTVATLVFWAASRIVERRTQAWKEG